MSLLTGQFTTHPRPPADAVRSGSSRTRPSVRSVFAAERPRFLEVEGDARVHGRVAEIAHHAPGWRPSQSARTASASSWKTLRANTTGALCDHRRGPHSSTSEPRARGAPRWHHALDHLRLEIGLARPHRALAPRACVRCHRSTFAGFSAHDGCLVQAFSALAADRPLLLHGSSSLVSRFNPARRVSADPTSAVGTLRIALDHPPTSSTSIPKATARPLAWDSRLR